MNFCSKCGSTIMPGSNACPACGEPVAFNNGAMPQPVVEQQIPMPQPIVEQVNPTQEVQIPVQPTNIGMDVNNTPNMAPMPQPVTPAMNPVVDSSVSVAPEMPLTPPTTSVPPVVEQPKKQKKEKKDKPELTSEEKEFKFNKITTITVVVVSIIALVVMGFFMYKALFTKDEDTGNTIKNATQYNYEGFEFFLPEGTIASVEDGLFVVKAEDSSWSAIITIQEGSYNTLVSNKSQISGYFENLGYVSGETEENEVSGMGFVTTEVLIGSQNVLVAYAKASGTKVYGILYTNELATYDNVSLKIVGEILASSISSGDLSSIPAGFTIEMFEQTFEVAR